MLRDLQRGSRGAGDRRSTRPLCSSPNRPKSSTTEGRWGHRSAMVPVRLGHCYMVSHLNHNEITVEIMLIWSSQLNRACLRPQHGRGGRKHQAQRRCGRTKTQLWRFPLTRLHLPLTSWVNFMFNDRKPTLLSNSESCRNSGGWGNKHPDRSDGQLPAGRMTKLQRQHSPESHSIKPHVIYSPCLQSHEQIIKTEQHDEGGCQHEQNGEQVFQVHITYV